MNNFKIWLCELKFYGFYFLSKLLILFSIHSNSICLLTASQTIAFVEYVIKCIVQSLWVAIDFFKGVLTLLYQIIVLFDLTFFFVYSSGHFPPFLVDTIKLLFDSVELFSFFQLLLCHFISSLFQLEHFRLELLQKVFVFHSFVYLSKLILN